jgi:protoheme IX farnesyltransferase
MNETANNAPGRAAKQLQWLLLAAGGLIFLLISAGGVLSATAGGSACPSWSTCLGSGALPTSPNSPIIYAQRALVLAALPFLLGAAWLAWKHFRHQPRVSLPVFAALLFFGVQIGLGAGMTWLPLFEPRRGLSLAHTLLALMTLASLAFAAVNAFYPAAASAKLRFRSPFARLSLALFLSLLALMVSGAAVNAFGSQADCTGWLLCANLDLHGQPLQWLHLFHRGWVALSALFAALALLNARKSERSQTAIITTTTAVFVLFFAQALLGARLVQGYPAHLLWLHQSTAVAAWAAAAALTALTGLAGRSAADERAEARAAAGGKGLLKDFLLLTKPIVVLLLLVTTFAGMVIGARALPPFSLAFWTLLGGFLAAGGSGAINQYIDRADDLRMQRTQKRPIPAGRLTPGEGLAFGVGIALASVYILVAFVNFLAAMLSLAGIIYYVLLYSVFLKKTTVQNIVIGGGAGAIPPLVGWAAATGSLNVPALFLFAIVFLWTPPHFWALALVRRKDYARAGVPMLPVVRGEKETRSQIMLYTLELVALTLLLPLFGLGGSIYLIGAFVLGAWLTLAAFRVWRQGGNKLAWKMYRYSSMYLMFLFLVLMVDRLI